MLNVLFLLTLFVNRYTVYVTDKKELKMPYPKTHYLRIALTFVACAISVYILCFVVFDSAANFVNEIFEPRGSLGALCIALLLALFNPDSTGKTSQIGKFVWGLMRKERIRSMITYGLAIRCFGRFTITFYSI